MSGGLCGGWCGGALPGGVDGIDESEDELHALILSLLELKTQTRVPGMDGNVGEGG